MEKSSSPSPEEFPVNFLTSLDDLLRLALSSFLDGTLEIDDFPFSKPYCAQLLQDDDFKTCEDSCSSGIGVPTYPLYKCLGRAIEENISHGFCIKNSDPGIQVTELEDVKKKGKEWNKLICDTGSELAGMFKAIDFEFHVQEPFFTQLKVGRKIIEGRCATGNYNRIAPGAMLLINKCLLLQVQLVTRYISFAEMLTIEGLSHVLPGVETIEEGVAIYRKFYSEEKEKSYGVLAIHVSRPACQPYVLMSKLLSELGYEGVGSLLGVAHTAGSVPDALPPPRSALISSFVSSHRPEVRGCLLTNGARALAKHVNRSSEGWWGSFTGNDHEKNKLALRIINTLLTHCCWMNIYFVRQHEQLFEIRVAEGYGARWSRDGSKFVGFLEPYQKEGHMERWRH